MCEMTAATALALSAAMSATTALAGYVQADQSAKKQTDANQKAYDDSINQLRNEQVEQDAQAKDQMSERARQAMIETAHLRALAAESGTTGGSNDRVNNEANFNAGQDIAAMQGNSQAAQRQLIQQSRGSYATAASRQAQIQQPSLIGTGLQIGGAYVNYQTGMNKLKGDATVKGST